MGSHPQTISSDANLAGLHSLALAADTMRALSLSSTSRSQDDHKAKNLHLPPIKDIVSAVMDWQVEHPVTLEGLHFRPPTLPTQDGLHNSLEKMSLDFIAPGGRVTESISSRRSESTASSMACESRRSSATPSSSASDADSSDDCRTPITTEPFRLDAFVAVDDRSSPDGFESSMKDASCWAAITNSVSHNPTLMGSDAQHANHVSKVKAFRKDRLMMSKCRTGHKTRVKSKISQVSASFPEHRNSRQISVPQKSTPQKARNQTQHNLRQGRHSTTASLSPRRERLYKNSNRRVGREERHQYDDDERYAVLYLRAVANLRWVDVVRAFADIFPPGTSRRCTNSSAEYCPSTYVRRCTQGLQCRYYRIREEEGLVPLRKGSVQKWADAIVHREPAESGKTEEVLCKEMIDRKVVSAETLSLVDAAATLLGALPKPEDL